MAKLLHIKASPRVERSHSNTIAQAFLHAYKKKNPSDQIIQRDLFSQPLPKMGHLATDAKYQILQGQKPTERQINIWSEIEIIIKEFTSADKFLFSIPMWNFSIPYTLKHYIDVIVQPTYTFNADENGYSGLITGKPACVIYARGGQYSQPSPAEEIDMQSKYMEMILEFIGFTDITTITAEPMLGEEETVKSAKDVAIAKAEKIAVAY